MALVETIKCEQAALPERVQQHGGRGWAAQWVVFQQLLKTIIDIGYLPTVR
jgi:hypothetical protein